MRRSSTPCRKPLQLIGEEDGSTMMEYALLACLAAVVVIIALLAFFRP